MTFESVVDMFTDYLQADRRYEAVRTSRGYAVLIWDTTQEDWIESHHCPTPEKLLKKLTEAKEEYQAFLRISRDDQLEAEANQRMNDD